MQDHIYNFLPATRFPHIAYRRHVDFRLAVAEETEILDMSDKSSWAGELPPALIA